MFHAHKEERPLAVPKEASALAEAAMAFLVLVKHKRSARSAPC